MIHPSLFLRRAIQADAIFSGISAVLLTLGAADLKRLIDKTQFAISNEETRYYLTGIYLHIASVGNSHTLRAVATDGHRLAQVELPAPAGADVPQPAAARSPIRSSSAASRRSEFTAPRKTKAPSVTLSRRVTLSLSKGDTTNRLHLKKRSSPLRDEWNA